MATKSIEIRVEPTKRDPYKFVLKVFADGKLEHSEPAHIGTVIRSRNRLAEHWSDHPDGPSVFASAIPWPAEYTHSVAMGGGE